MEEPKKWEDLWTERVGGFATKVGKTEDEIMLALAPIIGVKSEQALDVLADPEASPFEDLKGALTVDPLKIPIGILRKNISMLRAPKPSPATASAEGGVITSMWAGLPAMPDETSYLGALQVGGVAKVGELEVLSAVKGSLANRYGFRSIPDMMLAEMDRFAENLNEPLQGDSATIYVELRTLIVERRYSEILKPMGLKGLTVPQKTLEAFLKKMDDYFWAGIYDFHKQLTGWYNTWREGVYGPANVGAMMNPAFSAIAQQQGIILPTAGMEPPDTGIVSDAARTFMNIINKVFAGMGIYASRLVGFDAQRTKNLLEDARLPAMVGAVNRDQMLQLLKIDVPWDILRLEKNIATYAYAVMQIKSLAAGQQELVFYQQLYMLGNQIPWDKLMRAGDVPASGKNSGKSKSEFSKF